MSERDHFLKALVANEDDTTTRLVYADWLDEQGDHEEADRQRKWPAAKAWLVRKSDDTVSYQELLDFGRRVAEKIAVSEQVSFGGGGHCYMEPVWENLQAHRQQFWNNWSIVTGIPLPSNLADKGFHYSECCPSDVSFWFGVPDTKRAAEETDETF